MKKVCNLLLIVILLFVGCTKPIVESGPLVRKDFYFYEDGEISADPDAEEDGVIIALSTDNTSSTARGIKIGDSFDSVLKAYTGIMTNEIRVGDLLSEYEMLDAATLDILKDDPRSKVSEIKIVFVFSGYELAIELKSGKVNNMHVYTPEAVKARDDEAQRLVSEMLK
jgi:hypothetical protein